MMRLIRHSLRTAAVALLCSVALHAASPVVRTAPDFGFAGVGGKKSLRSLRSQPVVLVIAKSPDSRAFRKQAKMLAPVYQEFASRGTLFIAAFSEKDGQIPSNIPFIVASNGPAVANAYGFKDDILVAVIGPDGNLDSVTHKLSTGLRVREVIQNTFAVQEAARKETPKAPPQQ